ncbi:hypothetical protein ACRS5S_06695 [Nocardia asiatica]|uniref:hypothetical protein n=1 Tax=Nocardia asiatica TaxID=209252 RepID=UPI0024563512|nr:hypothetical protein [Nocardia asiatica]
MHSHSVEEMIVDIERQRGRTVRSYRRGDLGNRVGIAGITRQDGVQHPRRRSSPAPISFVADALGRDIAFHRSSREDTVTALTPTMGDTAPWYVDNVLCGYGPEPAALPVTSVRDITGRPATTFAGWAAANAARFAAN